MGHPIVHNTPQNTAKAVELTAAGQTHAEVAKALDCSVSTVKRMLSDPVVKQAVSVLRAGLRVRALEGAQAITPAAQAWLREVVEQKKDPRAADALSRALLNLEKVAASASGENQPLPTAQAAQQVTVVVAPGWVKPKQPKPIDAKVVDVAALPALPE